MKIIKIGLFLILSAIVGFALSLLLIFLLSSGQDTETETEIFFIIFLIGFPIISLIIFVLLTFLFRNKEIRGDETNIEEISEKKVNSFLRISQVVLSLIMAFVGSFFLTDFFDFVGDNIIVGIISYPAIFIAVFLLVYFLFDKLLRRIL
jgi:MFS family permease